MGIYVYVAREQINRGNKEIKNWKAKEFMTLSPL